MSVVGVSDVRAGETPKAFVTKKLAADVTEQDIIDFCRDRMAHLKTPRHIEFGALPKTAPALRVSHRSPKL